MRYHFIVNGYSADWEQQTEQLQGFRNAFLSDLEEGSTFILCESKAAIPSEKKQLTGTLIPICAKTYTAEVVLHELCGLMNTEDVYIFGSGFYGTELAVRAAERLGGSSAAGVHAFAAEAAVTVKKMVYSNHMEGTFRMKKAPYCIALAKGMERTKLPDRKSEWQPEIICRENPEFLISRKCYQEDAEKGLEDAAIVIAAGRGIKQKENVRIIQETATSLGGEFGVSRPAAMNAWAPMHRLIGVSGAMLQPEICIAAGVSGAAAFYAGIEKSRFIVAINSDETAPIVKLADVVIIDDFIPVLRELKNLVEN